MRGRPALLVLPAFLTVAAFLGAPICLIVAESFEHGTGIVRDGFSFSLENYTDLVRDDFYPMVLLRTALSSLAVTAITLVLGFLLALKLRSCTPRGRAALTMVIVAPMLVSVVARTYGWLLVLGEKGLFNTVLLGAGLIGQPLKLLYNDAAVVMGLAHLLVAFPALAIHASLKRIDQETMEAADMAGAGTWRRFTDILLPTAIPGIVVGATFAFTLSMSAYVTPALVGGERSALATLIYQKYIVAYDWNFGACLALFLLAGSLVGTVVIAGALTAPYRARIAALRQG